MSNEPKRYAIGTRAIVPGPEGTNTWRVVCATCDAGGTVKHKTYDKAFHAACRDSVRPCRTCGAD